MSKPRVKQLLLYLCTALAMSFSAYYHLIDKIHNLQFSDLEAAWTVFFLIGAVPVMFTAALICNWKPYLAAKLALCAAALGCCYYILTTCALFFVISILVFVYPVYVFQFTIPSLLLFFVIRHSRRIVKSRETPKIAQAVFAGEGQNRQNDNKPDTLV